MNEQNIFKNDNVTSNSAQLEILKKNFPNCFDKDGHFILDSFKEVIKESDLDFSEESYSLNWLGKSYAQLLRNEKAHTFIQPNHDHNNQEINKNSQNLLIKGDNLEVLKHLRNAYSEKIKMIYIDPPYNTGSDGFVYQDDRKFTQSELMHLAKVSEDEAKRILDFTAKGSNSHSAWLTFIYPRLYIARQLLREDGVIFISIDENEQAQLKLLCDDIFGEENFSGEMIWKNSSKNDQSYISMQHEYILFYVKNKNANEGKWLEKKEGLDEIYKAFENFRSHRKDDWEEIHQDALKWYRQFPESNPINNHKHYSYMDARGVYFPADIGGPNDGQYIYDVLHPQTKKTCKMPASGWRYPEATLLERIKDNYIHFGKDHTTIPKNKTYLKNTEYQSLTSIRFKDGRVASKELQALFGIKSIFTNPKDITVIKDIFYAVQTDNKYIVLDFFAGSGTTAHAVMNLNAEDNGYRQFILVQLPEVLDSKKKEDKAAYDFCVSNKVEPTIFSITKARIEKAGEKIQQDNPEYKGDLGFKIFETTPLPDHYHHDILELSADTQTEMFEGAQDNQKLLEAILTTWTLYDRIPLTSITNNLLIDNYEAQYNSDHNTLYLIHPNFTTQNIKTLIDKIETDAEFVPEKIVIYGFNFDSKIQRELDEALKSYQNKKSLNIDLLVRYY